MNEADNTDSRLRHALDGVAAFYGLLDPSGIVRAAGGRGLGRSASGSTDDPVGRPLWRASFWQTLEDTRRIEDDVRRAAAGQTAWRKFLVRDKGGRRVPVLHKIAPVVPQDGALAELAVLAIALDGDADDTSAPARMSAAATDATALRRVLDATAAIVAVLDSDGTVQEASGALLDSCGESADQLCGQAIWDWSFWADPPGAGSGTGSGVDAARVVRTDIAGRLRAAAARAAAGVAERFDAAITSELGGLRAVEVHLRPVLARTPHGPGGQPIVLTAVDISERVTDAARARFRADEAEHRSRNMLGVVHSIARQMRGYHEGDFADAFSDRLQGLVRAQDVLMREDNAPVSLHELVRGQLGHHADLFGSRILFDGPSATPVTPSATQALAIAINELATNAEKHGALSVPDGRVTIAWGVPGDRFWIEWRETGAPPAGSPTRRGFGRFVLEEVTPRSLRAEVTMDWGADGVLWRLRACGHEMMDAADAGVGHAPGRQRILIAEHEPLLAQELAAVLRAAGHEVVGPVASVNEALALARAGGCTAALLDLELGGARADAVACEIKRQGWPVIMISGYPADALPEALRGAQFVAKPVDFEKLLDIVAKLAPPG